MKPSYEEALQTILYANGCAMQLKLRLENPMAESNDNSVSNSDLAQSIINCFANAISILSDKPKSENGQLSDLSSKDYSPSLPSTSHSKKRKINNTNSFESWRDDSPNPIYYDGFIWRKYGQKSISNSNHPRSYYRCTYNLDQNCGATKHEQKIKDNPPVYRTTYLGHHTCKINHYQNAIFTNIQDPVVDPKSTKMIQFGEDLDTEKENQVGGFSFSAKEEKETIKTENVDQYHEVMGNDQDFQHVLDEILSSSSCSYPHPSGDGCTEFDSDLLLDNTNLLDPYDQFDFGLL